MGTVRYVAVAALVTACLSGCGTEPVISASEPVASPYDGPMSLPVTDEDAPRVTDRAGAAARAVECDFPVENGGGADYDSGLSTVQDDPEAALENWFEEEGSWFGGLPQDGYRRERDDGDRVLFSYDVDGRTKAAVIVADGRQDWNRDTGWGVESWAECNPAELPEELTEELDIDVWLDEEGQRVPTFRVSSHRGAEHCSWQDIRFLTLGEGRRAVQYVRDTTSEFPDLLRSTYDADASLPSDAEDTGWHREGRELWLAGDRAAAYLVSLDDPGDVERWPAARKPILCG